MTRGDLKIRTQQAINAIRVFKEKDYGWSQMEKMLYEILLELDDSDWQTGEPTEEGYYLVHLKKYYYKDTVGYIVAKWERNWWRTINIGSYWNLGDEIDAWQKIELCTEASE